MSDTPMMPVAAAPLVRHLVAGANASICDECVVAASDVITAAAGGALDSQPSGAKDD